MILATSRVTQSHKLEINVEGEVVQMVVSDREPSLEWVVRDLWGILEREHIDVPSVFIEGVGRVLAESTNTRSGLRGKAPNAESLSGGCGGSGLFNMIPSGIPGQCHRELLVLCYGRDSLSERLRRSIYHAGILCQSVCRTVLFVTTKWNPDEFWAHRSAIKKLRNDGATFVFVLIGDEGLAFIPV